MRGERGRQKKGGREPRNSALNRSRGREPIINIPAAIKAARTSCRVALPSKIERPLFAHRHKYRILSALHRGNDNRIPPSDSLFLSACYMMHLPTRYMAHPAGTHFSTPPRRRAPLHPLSSLRC